MRSRKKTTPTTIPATAPPDNFSLELGDVGVDVPGECVGFV